MAVGARGETHVRSHRLISGRTATHRSSVGCVYRSPLTYSLLPGYPLVQNTIGCGPLYRRLLIGHWPKSVWAGPRFVFSA